jgi:RimJ/RimL family protein N-acetyltransferase
VTTPRIQLTPLGDAHLDATLRWVNDPAMMRLLGRRARVDPAEHQRWFASLAGRTDCRYFAVHALDGGGHVGNVWLWNIDEQNRKAEVRILFGDHAARGHGYGSEAIDLIARTAFDELGLARVYAYVFATNPRAKRAFEKARFAVEGVMRRDRVVDGGDVDVYLLARLA